MDATYSKRLSYCVFFSVLLHLLILYFLGNVVSISPGVSNSMNQMLIVELAEPVQIEKPKKLVEVSEPSKEVPRLTDNIAEYNSVASAPILHEEGSNPGPKIEEKSDFDVPGSGSASKQDVEVASNVVSKNVEAKEKREVKPSKREKVPALRSKVISNKNFNAFESAIDKENGTLERGNNQELNEGKKKESKENENIGENRDNPDESGNEKILAMVTPKSASGAKPQGRVYNQVKKEGVLGFEALQDQIAPYLRNIQKQVERYWIHFLLTRYSGTKPTEIVIDCEINEDGKLIKAEVVGVAEDPFYASICKLALESASPFPPFPFKVPDIYQKRTLQIRWTFSFM